MSRKTDRRWHRTTEIGLVGPADVAELQTKVQAYHEALLASLDSLVRSGHPLPSDNSDFSSQAWDTLTKREEAFLAENTAGWNPLAYIESGSAYERGRQLIQDMDLWRDQLVTLKAPNVPPPIPVPHSDLGFAGGLGFVLAAVVAILLLHGSKR